MDEMHEKLGKLKIDLAAMGSVAIAFSSGVDSTFLLKVAHDVLGSHYKIDGTTVQVLALRDAVGTVHAAFNTCQSCSPSPKAYDL